MKITNHITPEIIKQIDDINKQCHAMHLPPPPINFINIQISDANGKIIEEYKSKSNSWVRNAYNMLSQLFLPCSSSSGLTVFGAGSQAIKAINGTTYRGGGYYTTPGTTYSMSGYAYDSGTTSNFGIIVGSGTTAESFEHNALASLIIHGTATGNLSYNAMTEPTAVYDSVTRKWTGTAIRYMNNASTGIVNINEIGYAIYCYAGSSTRTYMLLSRDLLSTTIAVPVAGQAKITYTSEITYPA